MSTSIAEREEKTRAATPETSQRSPIESPRRFVRLRSRGIPAFAAILGGFGFLVSFAGSWIPSYWGDEAASVMSAERPLSTLWVELGNVDAVHGLYYIFLHFWIQAFGATELSVRFPSAIAAGIAVAGTVVLASMLFGASSSSARTTSQAKRIAIAAGVVASVLPRMTYIGSEGRSYAMGTALAVWLSILFVYLLRSRITSRSPWIAYSLLLVLSIYLFLYLAFIIVVHAAVIFATRDGKNVARRWARSVGMTLIAVLPIAAYSVAQHAQIQWLAKSGATSFYNVFVLQWFGNWPLAILGTAIVVYALVVGFARDRSATVLLAAWIGLPMALLLAFDRFVEPAYSVRYLSFCTTAVAIAVSYGISSLGSRGLAKNWMVVSAVAVVVSLAIPTIAEQRGPFAKNGASDLRPTAAIVGSHAKPGDAIVFDEQVRPSRKPRMALHLYPENFVGLKDVTLVSAFVNRPGIWDEVAPVNTVYQKLDGVSTVWAIERTPESSSKDIAQLELLGYRVVHEYFVHVTTVYELSRNLS